MKDGFVFEGVASRFLFVINNLSFSFFFGVVLDEIITNTRVPMIEEIHR